MAKFKTETRQFYVARGRTRVYTLKSKRESLFARLLEHLVYAGDVRQWWYEPHTFRCQRMYRRERLYTPDFLVHLGDDVFDTGTQCVWVEVKSSLDQNGKTRLHCLAATYPWFRDNMILVVNTNPAGRKSKTAQRQRVLQDGAKKHIRRVLYASEWYPKFGIR